MRGGEGRQQRSEAIFFSFFFYPLFQRRRRGLLLCSQLTGARANKRDRKKNMHARHFIVIHSVYSNPVCIAADGWMGKGARTSSSSIIDLC